MPASWADGNMTKQNRPRWPRRFAAALRCLVVGVLIVAFSLLTASLGYFYGTRRASVQSDVLSSSFASRTLLRAPPADGDRPLPLEASAPTVASLGESLRPPAQVPTSNEQPAARAPWRDDLLPFGHSIGRVVAAFVLLRLGFPVHSYPDCAYALKLQAPLLEPADPDNPSQPHRVRWDLVALRALCQYEARSSIVSLGNQRCKPAWPFPATQYPHLRRLASNPLAEAWSSFDSLDWHDLVPLTTAITAGSSTKANDSGAPDADAAAQALKCLSRLEREKAKDEVLASLLGYTATSSDASSLSPSQEWLSLTSLIEGQREAMAGKGVGEALGTEIPMLAREGNIGAGSSGDNEPAPGATDDNDCLPKTTHPFARAVITLAAALSSQVQNRLGISAPFDLRDASKAAAAELQPTAGVSTAHLQQLDLQQAKRAYEQAAATLASIAPAVPQLMSSQAELNTLRWREHDYGPLASLSQCRASRDDPCLVRSAGGLRACIEDELCGWCPAEHIYDPMGDRGGDKASRPGDASLSGLCLSRSLTSMGGPLRRERVGGERDAPFCSSPKGLIVNALSIPSVYERHRRTKAFQLHSAPVHGGFHPPHLTLQRGVGSGSSGSSKEGKSAASQQQAPADPPGFFTEVKRADVVRSCGVVVTRMRPRLFTIATNGRTTTAGLSQAAAEATMAFHFMDQTLPKWYKAASMPPAEGSSSGARSDGLWTLRQHVWLLPMAVANTAVSGFSYSWAPVFTATCPRELGRQHTKDSGSKAANAESRSPRGICYSSAEAVDARAMGESHRRLTHELLNGDSSDEEVVSTSELLTGLPDPIPMYEEDAEVQQGSSYQYDGPEVEPALWSVWSGSRLGMRGTAALAEAIRAVAVESLAKTAEEGGNGPQWLVTFLLRAVSGAASDLRHFYHYQRPADGGAGGDTGPGVGHASEPTAFSGSMAMLGLEQHVRSHLGLRLWDEGAQREQHRGIGKCLSASESKGEDGKPDRPSLPLQLANPRPMVTVISRANKRFLTNERKVVAALMQRGLSGASSLFFDVQLVTLEGMPLYSQLLALQRTDVLIGVHGSGLINAIFMRGHKAGAGAANDANNRKGRATDDLDEADDAPEGSLSRAPLLLQLLPRGLGRGQGAHFFAPSALSAGVEYAELGGRIGKEPAGGLGSGSETQSAGAARVIDEASSTSKKKRVSLLHLPDPPEQDLRAVSSRQHWHFAQGDLSSPQQRRDLLDHPKGGECCGRGHFFSFSINGDLRVDDIGRLVDLVAGKLKRVAMAPDGSRE